MFSTTFLCKKIYIKDPNFNMESDCEKIIDSVLTQYMDFYAKKEPELKNLMETCKNLKVFNKGIKDSIKTKYAYEDRVVHLGKKQAEEIKFYQTHHINKFRISHSFIQLNSSLLLNNKAKV